MRLMVAKGMDERVLALHTEVTTATAKLARESDESASDVLGGRLPVRALLSFLFRPADGDGWLHAEGADRQRSRRCPLWQARGED